MRILVTGGAGFIGSHLVDALLDRGHEVSMADHLVRSPKPWFGEALLRGAQLYVADVRALSAIRPAFEVARPETVLHLAAQADVRHSVSDPSFDAQVNVAGTVAVLEAAREVGARRVVMASTAAVYGDPAEVPTGEDAPIAPLSPYGASKAAAEWYLAQYQRLYGISTLALRMANVYGPRQDPHAEAGVVSIFCGMAASGGRATVYGNGAQTRDYVFVDDVVAAWLAAAASEVTGALNISTSVETSVRELAEVLDLSYDFAPGRPGEIERSCLDASAAAEQLGWRAVVPLENGLRRTLGAVSPEVSPVNGAHPAGHAGEPATSPRRG
jgi:UDP-glucose 4-epimerase